MPDLLFFDEAADAALVGGKGNSLARMFAAKLPVPPGFVITTAAYRRLHKSDPRSDPSFMRAVLDAYRCLGGGAVAVRSSATAEDSVEASFAGQQETVLGVVGDEALSNAIVACWKSLHAERSVAYRRQQGITADGLAMAVVVQRLVAADVAGVLFTRDPHDPTGRLMAAEAAWGLGEVVVSGRVTPDRFRIDRETGAVVERHAGRKTVRVTVAGEVSVEDGLREKLCVSDSELSQLADLGRRVEAFYGEPRDIEWALEDGTFWLLQARPITTASASEREAVREDAIAKLKAEAESAGAVWVRYNLSEVLPAPTPMTWAVVGRLLAADGGFGLMNRDLGADPDPALGSRSAFDLVAGRPMCNLSRLPRMQFRRPPFEYPFAALKANPRLALDPNPVPCPGKVGLLRLPGVLWRMSRMQSAMRKQAETFAGRFAREVAPSFATWARRTLEHDWAGCQPLMLCELFRRAIERVLVEYARDSLKPTVFADLAWATLFGLLKPRLGEERAAAVVGEVAMGAAPPEEADLAGALRKLAARELDRETFLARFGHRGPNEMELAQPRWAEEATLLVGESHPLQRVGLAHPLAFAELQGAEILWAERLRTYLGLREAAKHYLLLGYAVIRRALVELDSRFQLRGGIFYLRPTELDELLTGRDVSARIAERRKRRQLELSLEVPAVLFSDDLDAIGRPQPLPEGATSFAGIPLSAGTAEAPALVLTEPTAPPGEPYVLVCPSTDPAWVPLFTGAKALVMETGGVLSHGAIVAREFGLPAVAGLPGITMQVRTGQHLRVDGATGTVAVVG